MSPHVPRRAATAALLALAALAAPPAPAGAAAPVRDTRPARAAVVSLHHRLDVNRMSLAVSNVGWIGWDYPVDGGLKYPADSGLSVLFDSGLWIGAMVEGQLRVAIVEYSSEFVPGPIVGGLPEDPASPDHQVWKVARLAGDPADTAHVERVPATSYGDSLVHHSWSEYMVGAAPDGAPWTLYRLPATNTPDPSDSVDVPGPEVLGDQMTWCVYDDADASAHTSPVGSTAPLGAEVEQTVFGFDRPGVLGDVAFVRLHVTNRSAGAWLDCRAGFWADPDIGAALDDKAGCDTTRSLGFGYNGSVPDLVYGDHPPVLGVVLLGGAPGGPGPMDAFRDYPGGSDPSSALAGYRLLAGLNTDGSDLLDPDSQPTRYQYSGDPLLGTGWLDPTSTNQVMVAGLASRDVQPGESFDLWVALVVSPGTDLTAALAGIAPRADSVRAAYDGGLGTVAWVPPAPPGRLALAGFRPNPAKGLPAVAFTLASSAPAGLEVLDLAGRRVWSRALASPSAGRHVVALDGLRLSPGVYIVRLEQGGERVTARGVVLR